MNPSRHVAATIAMAAIAALASAGGALPNLSPADAAGETIVVRGRVLDRNGNPVAQAEVFAYHADRDGRYHDGAHRGTLTTDNLGAYAFETIRPGGYGPAPHIHFRVKAAGLERTATLQLDSAPRTPRTVLLRGIEVTEFTFDIRLDG